MPESFVFWIFDEKCRHISILTFLIRIPKLFRGFGIRLLKRKQSEFGIRIKNFGFNKLVISLS